MAPKGKHYLLSSSSSTVSSTFSCCRRWLFFGAYLSALLQPNSRVQTPEKLFLESKILAIAVILVLLLLALTWLDLPSLERLADPHYIELPFG